ncbi:MAG: hypothetical protein AB1546_04870 [bacterium]
MHTYDEIDLRGVKPIPLKKRKNKVAVGDFARPAKGQSFAAFYESLPDILAAKEIKTLVNALRTARERRKPIVWFLGAHVIKVGLSPIIIDLMKRGYITAVGLNGAGMIHDVEIAMIGGTSEDVAAGINEGVFGMAEETAEFINCTITGRAAEGYGLGAAAGWAIEKEKLPHRSFSILAAAYRLKVPCTVHVAIGTDIVHEHPSFNPSVIGEATYRDFKIIANQIARVGNGGVIINAGSAVILPLIIEKGISVARNLGYAVKNFTGANLDFIRHYRSQLNPVQRAAELGGRGISIIGHHELTIPLIYWALKTKS